MRTRLLGSVDVVHESLVRNLSVSAGAAGSVNGATLDVEVVTGRAEARILAFGSPALGVTSAIGGADTTGSVGGKGSWVRTAS